jgi:ankyrin repeat protein
MANVHGDTPLHRACVKPDSTVDEIRRLIDEDPTALTKRGSRGLTPLHLALVCHHRDSSLEVIELLTEKGPNALQITKRDGWTTPLHLACRFSSLMSVVLLFITTYPEAAHMEDNNGWTPLHLLLRNRGAEVTVEIVELFLQDRPEALTSQTINGGGTPFILACRYSSSMQVILRLVTKYPEAACINDSEGWTPLHYLFRYRGAEVTVEIAELFLNAFPAALTSQTINGGRTPFILACRSSSSMQVILRLVTKCPEAACINDSEGWTPLHTLLKLRGAEVTVAIVELFLNACPESLASQTTGGFTPLHLACLYTPMKVIQLLIQRDPTQLEYVTNKGSTVLRFACTNNALPDETLLGMANRWSVSSIFSAKIGLPLPYELVVAKQRSALVIGAFASTINQATCAMIECALFSAKSTTPSDVIDHLERALVTIPGLTLDTLRDGTTSSLALVGTVRPYLGLAFIKTLVQNDALQEWMKEEHVQRLVSGIVRMHRAGRDYIMRTSWNDTEKGVRVLDSVNDNVDCLFLHFRESPRLFLKANQANDSFEKEALLQKIAKLEDQLDSERNGAEKEAKAAEVEFQAVVERLKKEQVDQLNEQVEERTALEEAMQITTNERDEAFVEIEDARSALQNQIKEHESKIESLSKLHSEELDRLREAINNLETQIQTRLWETRFLFVVVVVVVWILFI